MLFNRNLGQYDLISYKNIIGSHLYQHDSLRRKTWSLSVNWIYYVVLYGHWNVKFKSPESNLIRELTSSIFWVFGTVSLVDIKVFRSLIRGTKETSRRLVNSLPIFSVNSPLVLYLTIWIFWDLISCSGTEPCWYHKSYTVWRRSPKDYELSCRDFWFPERYFCVRKMKCIRIGVRRLVLKVWVVPQQQGVKTWMMPIHYSFSRSYNEISPHEVFLHIQSSSHVRPSIFSYLFLL